MMKMKMETKPSAFRNCINPTYQIELVFDEEPGAELAMRAMRSVANRFPGMKIRLSEGWASSMRTNVRMAIPRCQLAALAAVRGCSTTELLASMMDSAQNAAFDAALLRNGRRPRLYVSESPVRLSSYRLYGTQRQSILPAFGRNSRTFCDLGEIYLPGELAEKVRAMDFRIVRQAGFGSACTAFNFGDSTIINCSRRIREHDFEYYFLEELRSAGLDVNVEPLGSRQQAGVVTIAYSAL